MAAVWGAVRMGVMGWAAAAGLALALVVVLRGWGLDVRQSAPGASKKL